MCVCVCVCVCVCITRCNVHTSLEIPCAHTERDSKKAGAGDGWWVLGVSVVRLQ